MAETTPATGTAGVSFGTLRDRVTALLRRGDIVLALAIVTILVVLILPMPPWLLDVSLAFSITFSGCPFLVVVTRDSFLVSREDYPVRT